METSAGAVCYVPREAKREIGLLLLLWVLLAETAVAQQRHVLPTIFEAVGIVRPTNACFFIVIITIIIVVLQWLGSVNTYSRPRIRIRLETQQNQGATITVVTGALNHYWYIVNIDKTRTNVTRIYTYKYIYIYI